MADCLETNLVLQLLNCGMVFARWHINKEWMRVGDGWTVLKTASFRMWLLEFWDIKHTIPWTKSDFLKCKKLIMFRISPDVRSWEQNQEKKLNTLLGNYVILAARQKQEHILISSLISTLVISVASGCLVTYVTLFVKLTKPPKSIQIDGPVVTICFEGDPAKNIFNSECSAEVIQPNRAWYNRAWYH